MNKIKMGFALTMASVLLLTACTSSSLETEVSSALPLTTISRERADRDTLPPKSSVPAIPKANQVASITPNRTSWVSQKKKENSESVAWLTVPGTTVSDVVVQKTSERNGYYGTHDFLGQMSKNGNTYMDWRSKTGTGLRNDLSRNTVIYGHSWSDRPDDILFAQLKNYRDKNFALENPYIFLSTENESIAWEVFAVFDAHVNFPYNLSTPPEGYSTAELLRDIRSSSIYNYNVDVSPTDRVLTLSTCTFAVPGHPSLGEFNDYRFVIVAKMVPATEAMKSKASLTINPNPAPPDRYIAVHPAYKVEKPESDPGNEVIL